MIQSYRDLIVWRKSMDLVTAIYEITEKFPKSEMYGLMTQMRRSSTSIPSNIAEGRKHSSKAEFRRCLTIAFGSGAELETQIEIAKRLPFGKKLDFSKAESLLEEVMKMLNVLMQKLNSSS